MSTGTRLVLLLTLSVGALMATASFFVLREREGSLQRAMQTEVRAHAASLRIALEEALAAGRDAEAQRLVSRLRENARLYAVVFFDREGRALIVSDARAAREVREPPEINRVLSNREEVGVTRRFDETPVFSVIVPIVVANETRGALEVAESLEFVERDVADTRRNFVLTTMLLALIIFAVVFAVTRRHLARPVNDILTGAAAVGRGDLSYRVIVPRAGGEFARLAREFNRMADSLTEQRDRAAREAEERLRLERELRHSERLASVGRLAAGVAHEMGAPLNVIDARAEQLLIKTDAPPAARERNLTIIRQQAARITHIVRQLLTLARPYNLRRMRVDLPDAVREALEIGEADLTKKRIEISVANDANAAPIFVDADADFLRQALTNILRNAVQAMPDGGKLTIECRAKAEATRDGAEFASVSVADTGPGIAPEHLGHVFEPFFTTKDVGSGTGLGLAVTRRIVEEHGGRIEAANNPAGGAKFTIYLPLHAGGPNNHPSPMATVTASAPEVINDYADPVV